MKVRKVAVNPRKKQIELTTRSGAVYPYPFSRLTPPPTAKDPIVRAVVDPELANEGVSYSLASGAEGCVLLDQALDYNSDPTYVARMLIYRLTVDAAERVKPSGLSVRELARRLGTSVPQVYRLLDPTNSTKSLAQLLGLLHVLGCEVDVVLRRPRRRKGPAAGSGSRKAA